ncbi:MAG: indole-3-glycerol phosphate synthase TrpC [Planctomycetes bacterium]|jgi:indole-3-glycerol phosphate synthase|nr:indole-3-glycerol phosphate synthase TrpC [Planctomycetota bacterium]
MSILDEISAHKRIEVAEAKNRISRLELGSVIENLPTPPSFSLALADGTHATPNLIAEVKYRSPSKGILCPDFDPIILAKTYAQNGAAAISVLTDEKYFDGSLDYLKNISDLNLDIPLLRKDFIFDPYQLLEARAAGASAVLLIVAMLSPKQLSELLSATQELKMDALVEAHSHDEVEEALKAGARVIGVNNRDLHTFTVSLDTSLALRPLIPREKVMVAESGIHTREDISRLADAGVDAMLIGEGLVTAKDVAAKVREFTS